MTTPLVNYIKNVLSFHTENVTGIDFDTENVIADPTHIPGVTGFRMTPGGRGWLGVAAGGDWQIPICIILYTDDGGYLATYIPRKGNTVDWENRRAFDSEDDDGDPLPNPPVFDGAALLSDIRAFLDKEPSP